MSRIDLFVGNHDWNTAGFSPILKAEQAKLLTNLLN